MNTNMNTNCMITIQYLMSEHFSDSISNRSAQPEENTTEKKYLTRLLNHNNSDQLCDRKSSPTDLPESWSLKELLHNTYGLINHGNQIIPVTYREFYILSRPLKAMAHRYQHTEKEVYILSGPSILQPVTIALPHNDYGIITQHTQGEGPGPTPTAEHLRSSTHTQGASCSRSQALIASCKLRVDQGQNGHQHQNGHYTKPRVYRRTRSMLKIRCTDVQQTGHNYSQLTETQKAKFQIPSTCNDERNFVEHKSAKKISDDLVHPTKSNLPLSLILYFQKKGRKLQKMFLHPQAFLHLHPHWKQSRNNLTLQDQESQQERTSYSDFYM